MSVGAEPSGWEDRTPVDQGGRGQGQNGGSFFGYLGGGGGGGPRRGRGRGVWGCERTWGGDTGAQGRGGRGQAGREEGAVFPIRQNLKSPQGDWEEVHLKSSKLAPLPRDS